MRDRSTIGKKALFGLLAAGIVLFALTITGCVCCNIGGSPGVVTPTAEPEPTELPVTSAPTTVPTYVATGTPTSGTTVIPLPTATAVPTPVSGNVDARIVGYGTDKDTYNRGDTAICYVNIENIGEVPINRIDFRINVYTSKYGIKIHAINNQTYTVDQQDIQPGTTKRVELSVAIPEEYQGISTAGDYRFDIVVNAEGKDIGSFSKDVKVV